MLTPCIARCFQYMKHVPRICKNYPKITPIWRKNLDKAVLPQKIFRYSGVNHGVLEAMKAPATVGWVFAAMTVPKHASATHTKPLLLSSSMPKAAENCSPTFQPIPLYDENPRSLHPICGSCTCGFAHGHVLHLPPCLAGMMPEIMIVWLASAAEINNNPRKPTIVISCSIGLPCYPRIH